MDPPVLREAVRLSHLPRLRLRSVPLCRSTNAVLTVRLADESASAASTVAAVPKITRVATSTTRPFFRVLCTVA